MTEREDRFYNKIVTLVMRDTTVKMGYVDSQIGVYISLPFFHLYGKDEFFYELYQISDWVDKKYISTSKEMSYFRDTFGLNEEEVDEVLLRICFEVYKIVKDMFPKSNHFNKSNYFK